MKLEALAPDAFERIVFFTGAGLSAEAGIPTYRGSGGIWAEYDWQRHACQAAFDEDPERVWDFHDQRREAIGPVEPTLAHRIIAAVQQAHPTARIVTQNIDGLHQRAGSTEAIELHGSLWRVRCRCSDSPTEVRSFPIDARRCPRCEAWRRPDIIWFGDNLDPGTLDEAAAVIAECDLLISVGTSGVVYPAAELPRIAKECGATLLEVNPEETAASPWFDHQIRTGASEALSGLWPDYVP